MLKNKFLRFKKTLQLEPNQTKTRQKQYFEAAQKLRHDLMLLRDTMGKMKSSGYTEWVDRSFNEMQSRLKDYRRVLRKKSQTIAELTYSRRGIKQKEAFIISGPDRNHEFKDCLARLRRRIQQKRKDMQYIEKTGRHWNDIQLPPMTGKYSEYRGNRVGRVFLEPGSILLAGKLLKGKKLRDNKQPASLIPHVGVEIEFYITHEEKPKFTESLVDSELVGSLQVKGDASINPEDGYTGLEVCLLTTKKDYDSDVASLCAILQKHGAKVNRTCGLHVHIDMREQDSESRRTIYRRLSKAQGFLFNVVSKSRKTNQYCRKAPARIDRYERYHAINGYSLRQRGTIEVRMHNATTDPIKINYWIKLLHSIVNCPDIDDRNRLPYTPKGFAKMLKMDRTQRAYWQTRYNEFNPKPTQPQSGVNAVTTGGNHV